jgi:hypothetical protein
MGGRAQKGGWVGDRRGRTLMRCKERVGGTLVRQDTMGVLALSPQGGKRPPKTGFEG